MARIDTIPYEQTNGELKAIYDDLIQKRGQLSDVLMIQSLNPPTIKSHTQLYLDIMFAQSPLSRADRELIATVVSVTNGCFYCQVHHSTALNKYWKDDNRIQALLNGYRAAALTEKEMAMCRFAVELTRNPSAHEERDSTVELRALGMDDRAILDVVLVTSYFNFVNRMVMALGVKLEEHKGEGYKY